MSLQSFVAHQVHLPDDTLAFALDGYAFIRNRCEQLDTDVFETRLLLQRTICMLGAEAARIFYDSERMQREGAAPLRVQATLFGRGGVQALDGETHRIRKQLLTSVLTRESAARVASVFEHALVSAASRWPARIAIFDVMQELLANAVCEWIGIRIDDDRRIRDISAMIDGAGGPGPRNWRGRVGRARAEWWVERQIELIRTGAMPPLGILGQFATASLDRRTAAIELLGIIRPTVAVARVRRSFTWHEVDFHEGARVMLDLYGTNHDARVWDDPDEFRPERFLGWRGDLYTLIPQGGGDTATGHRCPGETLTIELMKTATRFLSRRVTYDVPPQDLSISLARIPALPASRFVVENVKLAESA